jgi:hypothetical protein
MRESMKRGALLTIIIVILLSSLIVVLIGCSKKLVTNQPVDACEAIQTQAEKDDCYLAESKSMDTTNLAFCDKIIGSESKESCIYNMFNNSKATVNCTQMAIGKLSDTCNMAVGIELGFPAYCDKIISVPKADRCYYGIISKLIYPQELENQICNTIYDKTMKQECLVMTAQRDG